MLLALERPDHATRWLQVPVPDDFDASDARVAGVFVETATGGTLIEPGRTHEVTGPDPLPAASSVLEAARAEAPDASAPAEAAGAPANPLIDPETGLPNRLQMEVVAQRWVAAGRRGEPLSALMVAVEIASPAGSEASGGDPAEVGRRLQKIIRDTDLVVRYDGDRFLLILPRCPGTGAKRVLHRLRDQLDRPFTAGTAEFGPGAGDLDGLIAVAEEALERARRVSPAG